MDCRVINWLGKRFWKKHIYVLSASDRFNYGDLLFPFIVKHYFSDLACVINCSTTQSDMSDRGALPTEDFSVLEKLSPSHRNILIIGGGECLFCKWDVILGYVSEELSKVGNNYPTLYPFTVGKYELKNLRRVIYNSVGGYQLNERPDLYDDPMNRKLLKSADYISVRDRVTSSGLSRMKLAHCLCADSAILMSKIFSDKYLKENMSDNAKMLLSGKYLFFQIGLQHLKEWTKDYASILTRVSKEKNVHICMCPIGTALGHDDPEALSRISAYLPSDIYTMINNPSIWDIMGLIRWSEIYVGTSLHGAITAMSYRVPLIVHGPKKLQIYIETWYDTIGSEYSFVSVDNLEKAVLRRMDTRFIISPEEQVRSVEKSIKRMRALI